MTKLLLDVGFSLQIVGFDRGAFAVESWQQKWLCSRVLLGGFFFFFSFFLVIVIYHSKTLLSMYDSFNQVADYCTYRI